MKRFLGTLGVFLLLAGVGFGQSLQFDVAGDRELSFRVKGAQDQRWILLGGRVLVAAVVDGKLQVEEFTWTAKPFQPQPEPEPGPNPPDPPPPPNTKWQVAIVIESNDLDNLTSDQKTLLSSLLIRQDLQQKGHRLVGILDPDAADTAAEDLKPWFQAAKGQKLPVVLLAPMSGGPIKIYPLPASANDLWKLLESPPVQEKSLPNDFLPSRCWGGRCSR